MDLALVLPLRNQAELTSLLARLYNPSSPDYRHFLSVAQFTSEFSPTAKDYQTVVQFAQANGFTVTSSPANHLIVPIRGTVAQIETAFHVEMNVYRHPTEERTFYSPDREPSLDLSIPVAHISGLNNFSIPRPMVIRPQTGVPVAAVIGSGPGGSYLASDMRAAYYGGTTLTGNGQAAGLLEFDGYNISDVNLTFSNAGQSYNVPVNNVLLDGATGAPSEDDSEPVLDIVEAIGMAPELSQVRVYIGTGQDDANILNSMASENIAKQLSCSWSWFPEDSSTDDVFFQEFAAQGQSFFAASGDSGAFDFSVSPFFYPQEDIYVTAVGATHLATNGAGGTWTSESAWNSAAPGGGGTFGSGGGISPDSISIPSWQAGTASSSNGGSTTLRNVPDVAMEGDFDNFLCAAGNCFEDGAGTSFAAPRWAGFMALVNQQAVEAGTAPAGGIGFLNPAIYSLGEGSSYGKNFHDITQGNNDTSDQPVWFNAVTGYDLVTGWGSAHGQDLINSLAGPQVPGFWIVSSLSTVAIPQGTSAATTITVTDAGGFDGSVHLAVTSALPSGVTASWGTNPTTGTSVLTLTASSSAAGGATNLTITGTSETLKATTNISVAVHAPDFVLSALPNVLGISPGSSGTSSITVTPQYGFSGNVSLAVSGLPNGVTAQWGTNPTSGTSMLTLTASSSAAGGTTNLTITGTSGTLKATTTIALTVNTPTFTLSANNLSVGQGFSGTTYVSAYPQYGFTGNVTLSASGLPNGVTASFSLNPITGYQSSNLTLTASASAAVGQYTITIIGKSGALTETTPLTLTIGAPSFTLSSNKVDIGQGTSISTQVSVNPLFGFAGSVNLAVSGLPSGVTASFLPNPTVGSTMLTLVASSSANIGTSTLTITGTSGKLTATTTLSLSVAAPTFTISASNVNLNQGTPSTSFITVNPLNGFTGSVTLSTSGLPSEVMPYFLPNPTTGYTYLELVASSSAAPGQYNVTITGKSGALTATTTFALTVIATTPTFTISAGPLNLGQGTSAINYISLQPQNGFTGSVTLSASGLPSGVTASFSPNSTVENSLLTLTASSSVAVGQYKVTITGKSGALTETTTFTLTIAAPSFAISAGSLSLGQGTSSATNISVNPLNGFTGSVTLSASGLPSGVTASFSPNPAAGANDTVTLTASSSVAVGQYNVTITGKSGALTQTATLALTIVAPSFTLSAGNLSLGQGTSSATYFSIQSLNGFTGSVTFSASGLPSGVTASFLPNPSTTTYNNSLILTASSSAAVGQYNVTITGTSGNQTASATLILTISAPTFTLSANSASLGQGTTSTTNVNVNPLNGFTGSVTLSASGLPSGVTASFSPNPTVGSSTLALTASTSAAVGQYNVTITGRSGNQIVTTVLALGVSAPTFTLTNYSYNLSIGQGSTGTAYISVSPLNGFTGSVTLSASGLPSGVTASFSPNPIIGNSTVTFAASSSAALGQYNVTITGKSGNQIATTVLTLSVYAPAFTISANNMSIGQGTSSTDYIYVNQLYGFTGNVTLSTSGLPSGVTASFSPNPATGNSMMTFAANSSAALGQYNVTITGKSGNQIATTVFSLEVNTPTFALSNYPYNLNIGPGSSGTASISMNPYYGFAGNITLSTSGLPSGVTASFSPNPTTGNSTVTFTASSSAPSGQYNVTITGKSGNQTTTTPLVLGISTPTFTLTNYSYGLSIGQSSSGMAYINMTPQNGFTGSVTLSASGLPSGVTASISPNPTTGATGNSIVTFAASSSAALGQYNVTITGKSGNQTATTVLTLNVYASAFTISTNSLNIGQGSSGTDYIYVNQLYGFTGSITLSASGLPSGVTASFSQNPATGNSVVTFAASGSAPLGQYNVTITGKSGNQIATSVLALGIYAPTFTISTNSLNIGQGSSGSTYVYLNQLYGFTGNVTLSASGLPSGVTASFSQNPTTGYSDLVTFAVRSSAALGQYNVTIVGKSGNQTATAILTLGVYTPTFTISTSNLEIGQGTSSTDYIYVNQLYGFTGNVALSASGLPSGVTASFSSSPNEGTTVTFAASGSAPLGQYDVTITGKSGNQTATTVVVLSIYVPTFTLTNYAYGLNLAQDASSTAAIFITPAYGFANGVTLSASGLPSGVAASFTPNPATGNSTITLTANSFAALGQYDITITGTSGNQTASTTLVLIVTKSASGLRFIAVTPCRLVDTRNAAGVFGGPELASGAARTFDVPASNCGIPSTAVAYSLNATVVPDAGLGYLTIWPAGQAQPVSSTLNSDGRVKANATITPAGTNGGVSVYVSDATQFILDIDGYFVPAETSASGLEFFPLTPCRIADTRNAAGQLGGPSLAGGTGRAFPVRSSACGIPSTAQAYSLNVTAVPHGSLGYLTTWPTGQAQPVVSTLNSSTGAVTANAAFVPAGAGGDVSIYVSDASDVILDVNGYFAPPATGGLSLYTTTPCRVLDTRNGAGDFDGELTIVVETSACAPPAAAQDYVLNATVVPSPAGVGYLSLWAAGAAQPTVSALNAGDGAITSNLAIVPTSNGSINAYAAGATNLLLDLSSYFAP